jgi:hypothetical protein
MRFEPYVGRAPITRKAPQLRGFSVKRLKRLELSTFCMASRRSSQLSYSRGLRERKSSGRVGRVIRW